MRRAVLGEGDGPPVDVRDVGREDGEAQLCLGQPANRHGAELLVGVALDPADGASQGGLGRVPGGRSGRGRVQESVPTVALETTRADDAHEKDDD